MLRFDINLIFTVVNLLVLYLLMKKFLFDKENTIFRQRKEMIEVDYAATETTRDKAETDRELRKSYADKIFNRSSRMLESIRSAILQNVQGVTSVAPYENDTNVTDKYGRPPHSIEIVVDGGDAREIAGQILARKSGGISTYGDEEVKIPGEYGEDITIRFNRPTYVYAWMRVGVTQSTVEDLPLNYADRIKTAIVARMDELNCGDDIVPQKFLDAIYAACPGISYLDITMFASTNEAATPSSYDLRSKTISARERAVTSETMIEVALDG